MQRLEALSDDDLRILDNMKCVAEMLAALLGDCCECVLHGFSNLEQSVIFIHNGRLTSRKIGSPVTDKALEILHTAESTGRRVVGPYLTRGADGRLMKSCTVTILNNKSPRRIIGMLCVNLDLDVPFSTMVKIFSTGSEQRADSLDAVHPESENTLDAEYFAHDVSDLIANTVDKVRNTVMQDDAVGKRDKTRTIIKILKEKGLFCMRTSIVEVAQHLNISKDAVYFHLRALEKSEKDRDDGKD